MLWTYASTIGAIPKWVGYEDTNIADNSLSLCKKAADTVTGRETNTIINPRQWLQEPFPQNLGSQSSL